MGEEARGCKRKQEESRGGKLEEGSKKREARGRKQEEARGGIGIGIT